MPQQKYFIFSCKINININNYSNKTIKAIEIHQPSRLACAPLESWKWN